MFIFKKLNFISTFTSTTQLNLLPLPINAKNRLFINPMIRHSRKLKSTFSHHFSNQDFQLFISEYSTFLTPAKKSGGKAAYPLAAVGGGTGNAEMRL